jgi:hypothetical protein
MPISKAEIVAIRDQLKKDDPALTPAQVLQGVRTLVHSRLQGEKPPPYPLPPAPPGKDSIDFLKALDGATTAEQRRLHDEAVGILAERKAAMHASVPKDVQIAFHRERPPGINDPHHYAQMLHGKALWEETDKLVGDALALKAVS